MRNSGAPERSSDYDGIGCWGPRGGQVVSSPFCHLHVHSDHSLRYSTARIRGLASAATEHDAEAVALTDFGLHGIPEFLRMAKREGVQPIVGCTLEIATVSAPMPQFNSQLVLLARNAEGYRNLCHVITTAHTVSHEHPCVDLDTLAGMATGLIVICSGPHAPVLADLAKDEWAHAREIAARLRDIVDSDDSLYLAVQQHGCRLTTGITETELNTRTSILAEELGIGIVATNDVRYLRQDDAAIRNMMAEWSARNGGRPLDFALDSDQFYFRSAEEMSAALPDFPAAIMAACHIPKLCDPELDMKGYIPVAFPEVPSPIDTLQSMCEVGLLNRYGDSPPPRVRARLAEELGLVRAWNLTDYILFLAHVVEDTTVAGLEVGPGRGCMSGSMILYLLGLTGADPLEHGLIFERWASAHRADSRPLAWLDTELGATSLLLDDLRRQYGQHSAALSLRSLHLSGRTAASRAAAITSSTGESLQTILELLQLDRWDRVDWSAMQETLSELGGASSVDTAPLGRIGDVAKSIEDLVDARTTIGEWWNPRTILACSGDLRDLTPMEQSEPWGQVCQFESWDVSERGVARLMVTELQTLSVLGQIREKVLERRALTLNFNDVRLDDPMTYDVFCTGDTNGVYMFEAPFLRSILIDLAPTAFHDLVVAAAFDSATLAGSGLGTEYLHRHKTGWDGDIPSELAPIVGRTYGLYLFQEQLMHAWHLLSGLSYDWCDQLRIAHGKCKLEKIGAAKGEWLHEGARCGWPAELLAQVWEDTSAWAQEAHSKAHAVSQALLGYWCAYAKAHFTDEFLEAHRQVQGLEAFWRFDFGCHPER